jgi:hypothetical protein
VNLNEILAVLLVVELIVKQSRGRSVAFCQHFGENIVEKLRLDLLFFDVLFQIIFNALAFRALAFRAHAFCVCTFLACTFRACIFRFSTFFLRLHYI